MRMFINSIAIFAFILQAIFSTLNALNMQSTENIWIYLWNEFIFVSFICSSISVLIFILLYNFNFKFLKNRILNTLLLVIVLFAGFIHIWQIIELKGIFLNSCVLVLMDIYIVCKIIQNVVSMPPINQKHNNILME